MPVTFRCGVGMVIVGPTGEVLAFERSDQAGAFQMPQGGMADGEEPLDALWRELGEETGLTEADVAVVAEVPEWLGYELPPGARSAKVGRGQVHKWFILRAKRPDPPVVLDRERTPEFRSWRWLPMADVVAQVAPFRRAVYRRLDDAVSALD